MSPVYTDITGEDEVLLAPPYPDMPDAEEATQTHIYFRSEPKSKLQHTLQSLLPRLAHQNTTFLMLYGVLGMPNAHPIVWPQGHLLHLSGCKGGPFQEYVESMFNQNCDKVVGTFK